MNQKNEPHEPLKPEDITLDGENGIIWRLCLRNGWGAAPDKERGGLFIDLKCVAHLLGINERTLQNHYMDNVPRYVNGLVRLSEVMRQRPDETASSKKQKSEMNSPLSPEDIIPGEREATMQRWCLRNNWTFVPDFSGGGEPFVAVECAAYMLGVSKKTLQNDYLHGVPRYPGGLVRMSEVMRPKSATD